MAARIGLCLFLLLATCLSGCAEAERSNVPDYAGVRGYPTIAATRATIDEEDEGPCLTMHGAREILARDFDEPRDLSVFRNKVVLVVRGRQKASTLSSLADVELSVGFGQKPISVDLQPTDYGLVSISADGALSAVDAQAVSLLRLTKPGP